MNEIMSGGLVIRLRPFEKFLINGVIVENGEKRTKLRVKSPGANILRLRDALHPEDATTPVKRLYYMAQLAVSGDLDESAASSELIPGLQALRDALPDDDSRAHVDRARNHVRAGEFYQVMRVLKTLLPFEEKLLMIARTKQFGAIENEAR